MATVSRNNALSGIISSILLSLIIIPGRIGREDHRSAEVRES